jgi:hypothetical protein
MKGHTSPASMTARRSPPPRPGRPQRGASRGRRRIAYQRPRAEPPGVRTERLGTDQQGQEDDHSDADHHGEDQIPASDAAHGSAGTGVIWLHGDMCILSGVQTAPVPTCVMGRTCDPT